MESVDPIASAATEYDATMTDESNPYCDALGIEIPTLDVAKDQRDANYYSLLIVVLLERGEPVTLQQAAQRFEDVGVAPAAQALASLKRCKPGRAPIYRDGDRYALDPHDEQADLWVFRLGLRPPAVIDRIETRRSSALRHGDPAVIAANRQRFEREREAHAEELGRMRRVLIHAYPARKPQALVLVDVAERALDTFVGDEIARAVEKLAAYDLIASIDVRTLLRTLRFDPGNRRLGELGPPQKTRTINRRGRTLKITTGLLVQGSCGISRPFGDETKMREYLAVGDLTKLRRRLEADAKSLYAIYQYGRLHGTVRLRWGYLDERLPAPWVHRDEIMLHNLKEEAYERRVPFRSWLAARPAGPIRGRGCGLPTS